MILLPRASGTVNVLPLILVPGSAVVMEAVWQIAHPIWVNSASPARTLGVIGPRDGAFVDRMKLAKATISVPSSSGSGIGSNPEPKPTKRPLDVFSSGNRG